MPRFSWILFVLSLLMSGAVIAQVGLQQPDTAPRGEGGHNAASPGSTVPDSAPPGVRVIHVHAEPASVQRFYGYRPEGGTPAESVPQSQRGAHRFERLVEHKAAPDRGVTYVNGAMNHTIIATIDADGTLRETCLHGAAEDLPAHVHAPAAAGPDGAAPEAAGLATADGEE